MGFTGVGDQAGPENLGQVKALLERAGIRQVGKVSEAVALLRHGDR